MSDKIPVRVWDINGPIFRSGSSDLTVQFCLYLSSWKGDDKSNKFKKRIQGLAEGYEKFNRGEKGGIAYRDFMTREMEIYDSLTRGMRETELFEIAETFVREAYEKGDIGFQPFAKTAYRQTNFGARPILLTSTPRPVVEAARIIMPGDVDFILSTEHNFQEGESRGIKDSLLVSGRKGQVLGEFKEKDEKNIGKYDWEKSIGIGDTVNDFTMAQHVAQFYFMNPDREAREFAKKTEEESGIPIPIWEEEHGSSLSTAAVMVKKYAKELSEYLRGHQKQRERNTTVIPVGYSGKDIMDSTYETEFRDSEVEFQRFDIYNIKDAGETKQVALDPDDLKVAGFRRMLRTHGDIVLLADSIRTGKTVSAVLFWLLENSDNLGIKKKDSITIMSELDECGIANFSIITNVDYRGPYRFMEETDPSRYHRVRSKINMIHRAPIYTAMQPEIVTRDRDFRGVRVGEGFFERISAAGRVLLGNGKTSQPVGDVRIPTTFFRVGDCVIPPLEFYPGGTEVREIRLSGTKITGIRKEDIEPGRQFIVSAPSGLHDKVLERFQDLGVDAEDVTLLDEEGKKNPNRMSAV